MTPVCRILLCLCLLSGAASAASAAEPTLHALEIQAHEFVTNRQWGKAQKVYRQILKEKESLYGHDDARLVKPLNDVVRVTCIDGKCEATIPYLNQILEIRLKTIGANSVQVATTYLLLGEAYEKMHDYANALSYFRKAVHIHETLSGKSSNQALGNRLNLIRVMKEKGDIEAAQKETQECLTLVESNKDGNQSLKNVMLDYQKKLQNH
jgi:tetratricopeptide (TPR) repeat protein